MSRVIPARGGRFTWLVCGRRNVSCRGECPREFQLKKSRVCTDATTGIERAAGEGEPQKARAAENLGGLDHGNPTFFAKSCRIS
eukprot:scaffold2324_cov72-Phaeocystis_antarctica.AAC.1